MHLTFVQRAAVLLSVCLFACDDGLLVLPLGQCTENGDCGRGQACLEGACVPLCSARRHCPPEQVCINSVCVDNPFAECVEIEPCATAQVCQQSQGMADARCVPEPCLGDGPSTCPDPPNYVCRDGGCSPIALVTCATLAPCGVGEHCIESDGIAPAVCAPDSCVGVGRGTCPDISFECIDKLCARRYRAEGTTVAGGVAAQVLRSAAYTLDGIVAPMEGVPVGNEQLLTSPRYRLNVGFEP